MKKRYFIVSFYSWPPTRPNRVIISASSYSGAQNKVEYFDFCGNSCWSIDEVKNYEFSQS